MGNSVRASISAESSCSEPFPRLTHWGISYGNLSAQPRRSFRFKPTERQRIITAR